MDEHTHHNLRCEISKYTQLPSVHVSIRHGVRGPPKSTGKQVVFMTLIQQDQTINLNRYETAKHTMKACFFFLATHFPRDLFSGPQTTKQKHHSNNLTGTEVVVRSESRFNYSQNRTTVDQCYQY